MKGKYFISAAILAALALSSCGSASSRMKDKAQDNLSASLDNPKELKILAVSEPDSAFGVSYFTKQEMTGMLRVMGKVTKQLMAKTKTVEDFSKLDPATLALARRQMTAANQVQEMIFKNAPKGEWSGWKVKIDYQSVDNRGLKYKAERWIFLDKDGENIVKTFELPLP